jgi:hypothetical protein
VAVLLAAALRDHNYSPVAWLYALPSQAAPPVEPPSVAPPPEAQAWDEDETPTDTLWVGRIPLNLVGGTRSMQSVSAGAGCSVSTAVLVLHARRHDLCTCRPSHARAWCVVGGWAGAQHQRQQEHLVAVLQVRHCQALHRARQARREQKLVRTAPPPPPGSCKVAGLVASRTGGAG